VVESMKYNILASRIHLTPSGSATTGRQCDHAMSVSVVMVPSIVGG
jgi:hypothetical protein